MGIVKVPFTLRERSIKVNKQIPSFQEMFLLEKSLETGSTDFLLRGLIPIALRVFSAEVVG